MTIFQQFNLFYSSQINKTFKKQLFYKYFLCQDTGYNFWTVKNFTVTETDINFLIAIK